MYCDEALDAVEAVAAGELAIEGRLAEHYAGCRDCAAALAQARRLEQLLHQRPVPHAPAQFTARTMARVRRARWRSEQVFDLGFNVAIAIVILALLVGAWALLNRTGLTSVSNDAVNLLAAATVAFAQRVAPALPLYLGATALVVTALGIWWWAERDVGI